MKGGATPSFFFFLFAATVAQCGPSQSPAPRRGPRRCFKTQNGARLPRGPGPSLPTGPRRRPDAPARRAPKRSMRSTLAPIHEDAPAPAPTADVCGECASFGYTMCPHVNWRTARPGGALAPAASELAPNLGLCGAAGLRLEDDYAEMELDPLRCSNLDLLRRALDVLRVALEPVLGFFYQTQWMGPDGRIRGFEKFVESADEDVLKGADAFASIRELMRFAQIYCLDADGDAGGDDALRGSYLKSREHCLSERERSLLVAGLCCVLEPRTFDTMRMELGQWLVEARNSFLYAYREPTRAVVGGRGSEERAVGRNRSGAFISFAVRLCAELLDKLSPAVASVRPPAEARQLRICRAAIGDLARHAADLELLDARLRAARRLLPASGPGGAVAVALWYVRNLERALAGPSTSNAEMAGSADPAADAPAREQLAAAVIRLMLARQYDPLCLTAPAPEEAAAGGAGAGAGDDWALAVMAHARGNVACLDEERRAALCTLRRRAQRLRKRLRDLARLAPKNDPLLHSAADVEAAERAASEREERLRVELAQIEETLEGYGAEELEQVAHSRQLEAAALLAQQQAAEAKARARRLEAQLAAAETRRSADTAALEASVRTARAAQRSAEARAERTEAQASEAEERGRQGGAAALDDLRRRLEEQSEEQVKAAQRRAAAAEAAAAEERRRAELAEAAAEQLRKGICEEEGALKVEDGGGRGAGEEEGAPRREEELRRAAEAALRQASCAAEEREAVRRKLEEVEGRWAALQREAAALRAEMDMAKSGAAGLREEKAAAERLRAEWEALYAAERERRRAVHDQLVEARGAIRVLCRVRPLLAAEAARAGEEESCEVLSPEDLVVRREEQSMSGERRVSRQRFEFDRVFGPLSTQDGVFEEIRPLVTSVLDGYSVCVFAYGQTGSGKTFTMEGVNERVFAELFRLTAERGGGASVRCSMLEIYNEHVRDLLAERPPGAPASDLQIRQNGDEIEVPGAVEVPAADAREVAALVARGNAARAVGGHSMNERSSRSHSILRVLVDCGEALGHARAKLQLIDLAGSERLVKTNAEGQMLKEAQNINRSLSALGDVIGGLTAGKKGHVPFRNSKLTFLLQDSMGGKGGAKVAMFVNVSPAADNAPETLCSLNFAARCRSVELGQAKRNFSASEVRDLRRRVKALEAELERRGTASAAAAAEARRGAARGAANGVPPRDRSTSRARSAAKLERSASQGARSTSQGPRSTSQGPRSTSQGRAVRPTLRRASTGSRAARSASANSRRWM